jgi:hypothetical protein
VRLRLKCFGSLVGGFCEEVSRWGFVSWIGLGGGVSDLEKKILGSNLNCDVACPCPESVPDDLFELAPRPNIKAPPPSTPFRCAVLASDNSFDSSNSPPSLAPPRISPCHLIDDISMLLLCSVNPFQRGGTGIRTALERLEGLRESPDLAQWEESFRGRAMLPVATRPEIALQGVLQCFPSRFETRNERWHCVDEIFWV